MILEPVPSRFEMSPEQRLAARIWRSADGRLIPLSEMPHRHLQNLPGFLGRRLVELDSGRWYARSVTQMIRVRETIARYEGWVRAVYEELARRVPGGVWIEGWREAGYLQRGIV